MNCVELGEDRTKFEYFDFRFLAVAYLLTLAIEGGSLYPLITSPSLRGELNATRGCGGN